MASQNVELNVLRSREGDRNARRAEVKKRILAWSGPWYAFFLAFAIAWGNGLLKAATVAPMPFSLIFPAALIVAALVIAVLNFDDDGMFDQPLAFTVSLLCALSGTAIVALTRFGIDVGPVGLSVGFVLSGIAGALLFVLWSEVLARFTVSRALFYLCSDMVFAAVLLWFLDHLDVTGGYAAILLCALASCVGVHRAWESFRGAPLDSHASLRSERELAGKRVSDSGRSVSDEGTSVGSGLGAGHNVGAEVRYPTGIFVALFVYVVSVVLLKTLGNEAAMGYVSYGMAFGPFLMLVMIIWGKQLPLSILYELALVLALLALLSQPLFGYMGNTIGIIASDAVLGLLVLLLAAVNIIAVQRHGYSISRFAALGVILLTAAIALGCGFGQLVMVFFPWGTGLPALTICLFAVVICTLVCLSGNRHFSYDVSLAAEIAAERRAVAGEASDQHHSDSRVSEAPDRDGAHAHASAPVGEAMQNGPTAQDGSMDEVQREAGIGTAASADGTGEEGSSESLGTPAEGASTAPLDEDAFFGVDGRDALCRRVRIIAQDKGLHEREAEVMLLLLTGMTSGEVAGELCIALGTVKAHTHNVYAKLGVHSREELRNYTLSYPTGE